MQFISQLVFRPLLPSVQSGLHCIFLTLQSNWLFSYITGTNRTFRFKIVVAIKCGTLINKKYQDEIYK